MVDLIRWELEYQSHTLFLHFDVEDHFLKLETFIRTARSASQIIEALDSTLFNGELQYELVVVPPTDGSFLSKLAVVVSGGAVAAFAFVNSEVGSAFIEGLTGYPPVHWASDVGSAVREIVDKAEDQPKGLEAVDNHEAETDEDDACLEISKIAVALTRAILEGSSEQLNGVGVDIGDLSAALEARSEFYRACLEDQEVTRVGFTKENDFPIPRSAFPERAVGPKRKEPEEPPAEWIVSIESIYVTSPNWDEDDQRARQWKGKDQSRRDCYFTIEDKSFWKHVKRRSLQVAVLDNLLVQWAYQIVDGRPKSRRVLCVLEFNGEKLSEALSQDAVNAILGDHTLVEAYRGQASLFDDQT